MDCIDGNINDYNSVCETSDDIISNGGSVIQNANGSVSVFINNGTEVLPKVMTKPCCEVLNSSYIFNIDTQLCMWNDGSCGPFKVVLNPEGNDGTIFVVDEASSEMCTLDVSFDYLLDFDCETIYNQIQEGQNGFDEETQALLNNLNVLLKECNSLTNSYQNELTGLYNELEATPYVIECYGSAPSGGPGQGPPPGGPETLDTGTTVVLTDGNIPTGFDKLSPNTTKIVNAFPTYGSDTYCLTTSGLTEWEGILGTNTFTAWLESNGSDTSLYSCEEVNELVALDCSSGNLMGTCEVPVTLLDEITNNITVAENNLALNQANCESLQDQIDAIEDENAVPCSTFTEMLETLNLCMTLEMVNPDTGKLETVYEESILHIGDGNLVTYLEDNNPNSGFYSSGTTEVRGYCSMVTNILTTEIRDDNELTNEEAQDLVLSGFSSTWLNFETNIIDPEVIDLITNEKIKISFKIKDCCVDFGILVDNIVMDRNCTTLESTTLEISKSPSFDMIRVCDNKKSWLSKEEFKHREFDLKFRDTQYDIDNYKLAINSKEVDLDINPANAIEQDLFCYVRDNACILTGTTEITGTTCGDNGIDLTDIITTNMSGITSVKEFNDTITSELIDVKGWKTMSAHPTLRLLYDRYMNSTSYCGTLSSQFDYCDMIEFSELVGTYWVDLIEQVVPSTTIWGSTYVYGNTIFDQQKYVYKKYTLFGCDTPFNGFDVVSPTSGSSTGVSITLTTLPNDELEDSEELPLITKSFPDPFCNTVMIKQINCGSEFVGTIAIMGDDINGDPFNNHGNSGFETFNSTD